MFKYFYQQTIIETFTPLLFKENQGTQYILAYCFSKFQNNQSRLNILQFLKGLYYSTSIIYNVRSEELSDLGDFAYGCVRRGKRAR